MTAVPSSPFPRHYRCYRSLLYSLLPKRANLFKSLNLFLCSHLEAIPQFESSLFSCFVSSFFVACISSGPTASNQTHTVCRHTTYLIHTQTMSILQKWGFSTLNQKSNFPLLLFTVCLDSESPCCSHTFYVWNVCWQMDIFGSVRAFLHQCFKTPMYSSLRTDLHPISPVLPAYPESTDTGN